MKENTFSVFFALVRAGLWEEESRLSSFDNIDLSEIYRLAEEQSIIGLVAAGLEHVANVKLSQEFALQFVGQALQLEQRNIAMNRFVATLVEKMRDAGIYTLLVKGQGVAQCYERPLWRACGDVDFFLSDVNYKKAKDFLSPLAESIEPEWETSMHLGMTIDGWAVELHGSLRGSLSPKINQVLENIKQETFYEGRVRSWINNGAHIFLLNANNDIIYVFTHFLNHFYKGGIGLRQICDWCRLLWTYRESLNHELLESRIQKMGLISEWRAFGAFAVDYLGMPSEAMPMYSADEKWKRKAQKICSFVLEVGNFGHNRDMGYYNSKPYLVRKTISLGRRCSDLFRHVSIFPLDSLRFFPNILFNGLRSTARGE